MFSFVPALLSILTPLFLLLLFLCPISFLLLLNGTCFFQHCNYKCTKNSGRNGRNTNAIVNLYTKLNYYLSMGGIYQVNYSTPNCIIVFKI